MKWRLHVVSLRRVEPAGGPGRPGQAVARRHYAAQHGYVRFAGRAAATGEVHVTFTYSPRAEDRRLKPLAVDPAKLTRHCGVTLWNGPSLLLANTDRTRPALLAEVGKDGRLRLPQDREGDFRLAVAPGVEATEQELAASIKRGENVLLAPWSRVRKDAQAAFVFDLIAVLAP